MLWLGKALLVRRGFSFTPRVGTGDEFHQDTGGAPGGGELVEGEQEVALMQALGAGR